MIRSFVESQKITQVVTCCNNLMSPEYQQNLISGVGQLAGTILTHPAKILSEFFSENDAQTQQEQKQPQVQQPKPQPQPEVQKPQQPQVQQPKPQPKAQPQPQQAQPQVQQPKLQQAPKQPQFPPSKYLASLKQLHAMGFTEINEVNTLLEKYHGDVTRVVTHLLG